MSHLPSLESHDLDILRRLAGRKAELAAHPLNLERRRLWYQHDAGRADRPLVLAEIGGALGEVMPPSVLECRDESARELEHQLRCRLYEFEVLQDDRVLQADLGTPWQVQCSDYGVRIESHYADNAGKLGARSWDSPIKDLDADFAKLRPRTFTVDREATAERVAWLERIFQGLLKIQIRGAFWWTLGMTWTAIDLIGLEHLMLAMYDEPEGLHRLMGFLRDDHLAYARWLQREGLLTLNNECDYIGSGSFGFTRALPQADYQPGTPVRMRDLWVLLESQETVGVGPEQFAEFILPYQMDIAREFGRVYYGCCEPVHSRIAGIKSLPHLARVSVSPWADEAIMARELGTAYVYSRKPHPNLVSTELFDENAVRADVRKTMAVAGNLRLEFIMKDVHTVNKQPQRLARWVKIVREETEPRR